MQNFVKADRFIRIYEGTRYLLLFGPKKYNVIYDRIRYLISQKKVLHVFSHSSARVKIGSHNSLLVEKNINIA